MISYLNGKIILKKDKFIVLDVGNIGYKVFLSKKTIFKLPEIGQNLNSSTKLRIDGESSRTIKFFCYLVVKENALDLYGFLDEKELEFFEILNDIRGIGPKAALEISSVGPLDKIRERILNQDSKIFEGISGVGKKKAMTIILELSEKIKEGSASIKKIAPVPEKDEAEDVLVGLGFSRLKARDALKQVSASIEEADKRVKEALKILGK